MPQEPTASLRITYRNAVRYHQPEWYHQTHDPKRSTLTCPMEMEVNLKTLKGSGALHVFNSAKEHGWH